MPFLEMAINLVRQHLDLFKDGAAVSKITALAGAAKEKVDAEERLRKRVAVEAVEAQKHLKEAVTKVPEDKMVVDAPKKQQPVDVDASKVEAAEASGKEGPRGELSFPFFPFVFFVEFGLLEYGTLMAIFLVISDVAKHQYGTSGLPS